MLQKLRILFLCTGNACRSQMAEGWARHLRGAVIEPYSAGIETHGLNPRAVRVMAEAGVDISGQRSKHVDELRGMTFDGVMTVCGQANEHCPIFPSRTRVVHVGFDDPPMLARDARTEEEALAHYRRVRDEIRAFIETLPEALGLQQAGEGMTEKTMQDSLSRNDAETVRERVREGYAEIARAGSSPGASCGCGPSPCCGPSAASADDVAKLAGYSAAELAQLPEGANMGLSCGNPTALAALRPGEVVVDLGSGGGFDVFLAGPRVGPSGRVIGVDMTPDMVAKARRNAAAYRRRTGLDNVEFRLGEIEHLPVADRSVDVVISNCVINLSPDKPQVWREMARVLKPGGRVAVSDLALLRPLPAEIEQMAAAWIGCIAGAVLVAETERRARDAGLTEIRLEQKPDYVASMTSFEDPLYQRIAAALPAGTRPSDYVTSLNVTARKPA